MVATFNAEVNEQIRELTNDELVSVSGGSPLIAGLVIAGLGVLAFDIAAGAFDGGICSVSGKPGWVGWCK